jgi:hypothetical protein
MQYDILNYDFSVDVAKEYAETEDIVWDPNTAQDTVNNTDSKLVYSGERNKEFDHLDNYRGLSELRDITSRWMCNIFGHEIPLYQGWIVRYSPTSNVDNLKIEGSLSKHVDGSSGSGDLCAVVCTYHHGKCKFEI